MPGIRVGDNHLGRAVYAAQEFATGELVGTIRGRVINDPEYSSHYSIDLGVTFSLDPQPPFRFLNHCCTPNCELILVDPPASRRKVDGYAVPRVTLVARKRVRAGDELTIDYAWPAEAAIPCGCGSRWCRGWVVARSQRNRVVALQQTPQWVESAGP